MTDKTLNTQFEQFTRLQEEALENLRARGAVAADLFEKAARYQQALVCDAVDFAIRYVDLLAGAAAKPRSEVRKPAKKAAAAAK